MKSSFRFKLLKYYCQDHLSGFTLVELLVVFLIVGILMAIGMPSYLTQTSKSRQAEAKQLINSIVRAQITYRSEYNSFATSFDSLGVGAGLTGGNIATSNNFTYKLNTPNSDQSTITGKPLDPAVKSYTGGNFRFNNVQFQTVIIAAICESNNPNNNEEPPEVGFNTNTIDCPGNYKLLE